MNKARVALSSLFCFVIIAPLVASCARPDRPKVPKAVTQHTAPSKPVQRLPEIRGVWVSNTDKLDWDRATRELQAHGFNSMYVNLASGGAAFYPSKLVPQVAGMSGDPVARGFELAHQRGIRVHAKLIATFMFKTTPDFQQKLAAANRVMRGPGGQPIEQAGYFWLCPTHAANRELLIGLTDEMCKRYPIDGFHLDYIRFSEQPCCYCTTCRAGFEKYIATRVKKWPQDVIEGDWVPRWNAWRQRVISDRLNEMTSVVRDLHPQAARSAAVFPDLMRAREEKAQDWKLWLESRYLDYICPMNYNPNLAEFESSIRNEINWAGGSHRVVVGIGSWKLNRLDELVAQINKARQLGAYGFILFSYDDAAARDFLPQFQVRQVDGERPREP